MKRIDIGTEFSRTPLGRYHPKDGPNSGERFRREFLTPALRSNPVVIVRIDQVEGYGSSFLEEAFGGLVRKEGFTSSDLKSKLQIECLNPDYEFYKAAIWRHIDRAKKA
ncbi:MAG: STAS-like domain-containing protein [Fimbriimonadaceae bacterium]